MHYKSGVVGTLMASCFCIASASSDLLPVRFYEFVFFFTTSSGTHLHAARLVDIALTLLHGRSQLLPHPRNMNNGSASATHAIISRRTFHGHIGIPR